MSNKRKQKKPAQLMGGEDFLEFTWEIAMQTISITIPHCDTIGLGH